jgi:hypothetical protein
MFAGLSQGGLIQVGDQLSGSTVCATAGDTSSRNKAKVLRNVFTVTLKNIYKKLF